jgi:outer membrane protein assembly factor BamB
MKTSDLIFIGIKGSVVALYRDTGQQAWITRLRGGDFVNVVLERDKVLATAAGEIFCLDAVGGRVLWHNPLKGFGRGLATIATEDNPGSGSTAVLSEKHRRDAAAAAAAGAAAAGA